MNLISANSNKTENRALIFINIIGCLLFLSVPLLITPKEGVLTIGRYAFHCVTILLYMIVFYLNYLLLIKKYLFNRKLTTYLIINIIIVAILTVALQYIQHYYFTNIEPPMDISRHKMPFQMRVLFFVRDIMFMILVAGLAVAIKMTVEWMRTERIKSQMEAVASETELKNLRQQINPHFLFNTLNNIYALTETDKVKAQEAILGLSKILRYTLYENNQNTVPLPKELMFTKSYTDIMSLRLGRGVKITLNLPDETDILNFSIAPMLFITLIENAFKHGISQTDKSFIEINISAVENQEEGTRTIKCIVKNSYFPKDKNDKSGSGIGTNNLKRRLALLYPDKHLYYSLIKEGIYIAHLQITDSIS